MARSAAHALSTYQNYMKRVNRNLMPRKKLPSPHWLKGLPFQSPGLDNLLNSFSCGSPQDKLKEIEEWNPFSQRPIFELEQKIPRTIEYGFGVVADVAHRLVIVVHEAHHVLMWEPFFTGHETPNARNFRSLSLAFEGYCFWYADIIFSPLINLRMPDGERVLERYSVSQSTVNPVRALECMNIVDTRSSMEVYVSTFTGFESEYLKHLKHPIVHNLAERFYSFYEITNEGPRGMFRILSECGMFTEFFDRFCRKNGVPSILPCKVLKTTLTKDPMQYCWDVFQGMNYIDKLPRIQILRVRCRRSIQTRAYFAYSLRFLVKKKFVECVSGFPFAQIVRDIDQYLNLLENQMDQLCQGVETATIERGIELADQFYSRHILTTFKCRDAYVGMREQIYPHLDGHTQVAVTAEWKDLSLSNLRKFAGACLDEIVLPQIDLEKEPLPSRDLAEICLKLGKLLESKNKVEKRREIIENLKQALRHELVFKKWSLPLHTVNPEKNSFREILFKYA